MDEELIRTHEKASSPDSISPEKPEEVKEKEIKKEMIEKPVEKVPETPKKRKIDDTVQVDRPTVLETPKRTRIERQSTEPVVEQSAGSSKQSTSNVDASEQEKKSKKSALPKKRVLSTELSQREPSVTEPDPLTIWSSEDDLALITAVSHVSCVRFVHETVPFSRKFTFADLEKRFHQLMYDDKMSVEAKRRISQIPYRKVFQIQSRTPFSRGEEKCLVDAAMKLALQLGPDKESSSHTILRMSHFRTILDEHRRVFHVARTPQVLSDHFRRIKGYDETRKDTGNEYEQLEELPRRGTEPTDFHVPLRSCQARFHSIAKKPALRGILSKFKTNVCVPDNAIAVITGQFLSYPMTTSEVTMGRCSKGDRVDIDLSIEGPACKISRQQAIIRHTYDREFVIINTGQRPMFVDCKPLPQLVATSLRHGSIIEVATIRVVFNIPVPRVLHPITKQTVQAYRRTQEAAPKPNYQQYQKQPTTKKPRGTRAPPQTVNNSVHSVIRTATPEEHDRLLKAVTGGGGGF